MSKISSANVHSLGLALAHYMRPHTGKVAPSEKWPMPSAARHHAVFGGWLTTSVLKDTVAETQMLRRSVSAAVLHAGGGVSTLNAHANFVIKVWARLPTSPRTIARHVDLFHTPAPAGITSPAGLRAITKAALQFPFDGVSSWSKWLSFSWPSWALVYDSRIAFCLNAINLMAKIGAPAFPTPKGQGNILKIFDPQILAMIAAVPPGHGPAAGGGSASRNYKQSTKTALTEFLLEHVVDEEEFYERYLDVMQVAHAHLWTAPTTFEHTEMLLFCLTDDIFIDLVKHLMPSASASAPRPIIAALANGTTCPASACPLGPSAGVPGPAAHP